MEVGGDCFISNFNYVLNFLSLINDIPEAYLCYGLVIGSKENPVEGKTFTHCWIELGDVFIDCSNGKHLIHRKDALYATGTVVVDSVVRYDFKQARELILEHEHYDPCDDSFIGYD